MTFNLLVGMTVASLLEYLPQNPSVVELGNQRFTVSDEILNRIKAEFDSPKFNVDLETLSSLIGKSREEKYPLTDVFYRALGFRAYNAIDVNQKYGSLMMDLNYDLRERYNFSETFDLVTNSGTGEHIFNQFAVFKNIHQLTAIDGIMLHIMPFINWVNHGFYNFHPILYADLAAANQYELVKLSIANRWGFEVPVAITDLSEPVNRIGSERKNKLFGRLNLIDRILKKLHFRNHRVSKISISDALLDIRPSTQNSPIGSAIQTVMAHEKRITGKDFANVAIVAALQRKTNQPFVIPIQGKYVQDVESCAIAKIYQSQT